MDGESDLLKRIRSRLVLFDDDALAALANKGLVRRAQIDLENNPPTILGESDGRLRVRVEDAVVEVDETPQNSRCSCPSGTVCRHVLAVLIFLRYSTGTEEPTLTSCADEILAVDEECLRRWAGTPLLRRAKEKLSRGLQIEIQDSAPAVFSILTLNVVCRWMPGSGLQGMVCSCHALGVCEHRVAAVLAYQVARGKRNPAEEAKALEASSGAPRTREEVLSSVGVVLREMVSQGLSRASTRTEQRLRTLAVSAHGVDLPRLERLLRSLGDEVSLLLSRDAQADTRNLLLTAARVEALCCALAARPTAALVGEHRSAFDPVGNIELVGMGARRWRTRSGYIGLTVYFWDKSTNNWATWTDARPLSTGCFDAHERYYQDGPWPGCSSPAQASKGLLRLTGAWRNQGGRLSGRPGTRAVVVGPSDPRQIPAAFGSWGDLVGRAADLFGERFRERRELDELVVMAPTRWGRPVFDDVRQEIVWPVYDAEGREVLLVLPHTSETAGAMSTIEQTDTRRIHRLLGILRTGAGRLVVEPVSLYGESGILNLTLESVTQSARRQKRKPWLRTKTAEITEEVPEDDRGAESSSSRLGLLLTAIESEMEAIAERGICSPYDVSRFRGLLAKASSVGLQCCVTPTSRMIDHLEHLRKAPGVHPAPAAEALLMAYYVCRAASTQELIMGMVNG